MWASALGIALFQVVGTFGASDEQPERRAVDALAIVLVLVGPAALAVRDRWPLAAVAVAAAAADVYIGLGYPYGPIFVSVVVALYAAVQAGHRRPTWYLAGFGFAGFVVAHLVDPRADSGSGWVHLALVAGWLVVVLAVSEVVRSRQQHVADLERAAEEEQQRLVGEQRLRLAQELHDVLAHNISLINVQASVALHLLDDEPEQARPALATIKEASRDALHELRAALDLLRRGDAPRAPSPAWPTWAPWSTACGPAGWRCAWRTPGWRSAGWRTGSRWRRCRRRSSWPPIGSCRRPLPTSPATPGPAPSPSASATRTG